MKAYLFGLILGSVVIANGPAAMAQQYTPAHGYRYRTTYREWDRAVYNQYGYYEQNCQVTYTRGGTYHTCYEMAPTDYVYVEERQMSNGYSRVMVYRDQHATQPYTSYYVYDHRVHERHFYHHRYYSQNYYSHDYYSHQQVWIVLDWNQGFDKVIIGSYTALVGLDVLTGAQSDAEAAIGAGIALLGSASISSGMQQLQEESDLQKQIKANRAADGNLN